ncbi:MAG: cell wall hydrolase [Pseudomonadota bacterium]
MRLLKIGLLAAMAAVKTPFAALASDGETLRQIEAQGMKLVSPRRMRTLLIPPKQSNTGNVHFSKKWLDAQPAGTGGADWKCLSEALYFEARGETIKGQFAVAEVILNRVKSARFPQSICGVIRQGTGRRYQCQFTYTCDGRAENIAEPRAFERVAKIARSAIEDEVPQLTNGATHYHTTAVRPRWSRTYTRTARIGMHIFYRHTFRTASN